MSNMQPGTPSPSLNTLKEIPTPAADACQIVALQRQGGKVVGYQLSNGQVLDKAQAVQLARNGGIAGVGISVRKGNEYLKTLPDQDGTNNLGNLPSIT